MTWARVWWAAIVERLRLWPGPAPPPVAYGAWWPGAGASASYGAIYRTQPHVRTVVDFLA